MEIVASEMFKSNDQKAIAFLEEAESLINCIPALVDRSHRLVLQRDFILLRDFGYYYETLPLG